MLKLYSSDQVEYVIYSFSFKKMQQHIQKNFKCNPNKSCIVHVLNPYLLWLSVQFAVLSLLIQKLEISEFKMCICFYCSYITAAIFCFQHSIFLFRAPQLCLQDKTKDQSFLQQHLLSVRFGSWWSKGSVWNHFHSFQICYLPDL